MKLLTATAAVLVLAGCASSAPAGSRSRNLSYGLFYDFFRPESSKQAEVRSRIDRPLAPEIDETYDVSRIRAPRQYSEVADDYELSDWRDGVLVRADDALLRKMREDTAAKVQSLEERVSELSSQPRVLTTGLLETEKRRLETERKKLEAIDARLRS